MVHGVLRPVPASHGHMTTTRAARAALGESGAGEEEDSTTLPLTLTEWQSAVSDDSSDDEEGVQRSEERVVPRLSDEAAFSLLLDCHGLSAEQAATVAALTIFQQHRYRRISGLQPFSALRQLELLHQSTQTHTRAVHTKAQHTATAAAHRTAARYEQRG